MKYLSLVLLFASLAAFAGDKPLNIVVFVGGHEFDEKSFFAMFDAFDNIRYRAAEQPAANDEYAGEELVDVDVLVFYDMVQDISEAQKAGFLSLLQRGVGVVFLHHSLVSYQNWEEMTRIRGGRYVLEESLPQDQRQKASTYQHDVEMTIEAVDPEHPITHGMTRFVLHDEAYGNLEVHPQAVPLLRTDHPASSPVIGWMTRYGASKIVCLQPGHDNHAFEDPNYRLLVERAICWVAE